ncbi:MAG: hypothetical protein ACRDWI_02705 [Jiangellaceae bacterium]
MTLGAFAGLLVVVGIGAALVAPVATHDGGGWWWVLALSFPGLAALTALGVAAGRLVPSRLTAPVAAIACYALMVGAIDSGRFGGVVLLSPTLSNYDAPGYLLPLDIGFQQALWFAGLTATALVVVGARRKWLALIPAVVALAGAVPLVQQQGGFWQQDPTALDLVCTEDAPEVCLTQINAFLLDDVTEPFRQELARWEGVPGGPVRAVRQFARGRHAGSFDTRNRVADRDVCWPVALRARTGLVAGAVRLRRRGFLPAARPRHRDRVRMGRRSGDRRWALYP